MIDHENTLNYLSEDELRSIDGGGPMTTIALGVVACFVWACLDEASARYTGQSIADHVLDGLEAIVEGFQKGGNPVVGPVPVYANDW